MPDKSNIFLGNVTRLVDQKNSTAIMYSDIIKAFIK